MRNLLSVAVLVLCAGVLNAATINVPADQPTIQAGIDAASNGDTVLVADGVYSSNDNHNIRFHGKKVVLKSENGAAFTTLKYEERWVMNYFRAIDVFDGEDSNTVIDGFTFLGWVTSEPSRGGGGIMCENSSPTIKNCVFARTLSYHGNCVTAGAAIWLDHSEAKILNNTFAYNKACIGSSIHCDFSKPLIARCIFAYGEGDEPISCYNYPIDDTTHPTTVINCNVFDHTHREVVTNSCYYLTSDSLTEDPLFCDPGLNDFSLQNNSPCLPANNGWGVLIGALGEGCMPTDVEDESISEPLPDVFSITQNYPNPFNPATTIEYYLPSRSAVKVEIYDITGRLVRLVLKESQPAGRHRVLWNGENSRGGRVASGVYFYRLTAGEFVGSKKMVLLR